MKNKFLTLLLFIGSISFAQVANMPPNLTVCDDDNDGFFTFDLTLNDSDILGAQNPADYTVSYFETLAEANLNLAAVGSPYDNLTNPQQTLYANVVENATGNIATTSFQIEVLDSPEVPVTLTYTECDHYQNQTDGIMEFDLINYEVSTLLATVIANGGTVSDYTVSYYIGLLLDGSVNTLTQIPNPSAYVNTVNNQPIYAVVINIITGCSSVVSTITLQVVTPPTTIAQIIDVFECDDDTDGFLTFDLTSYFSLITTDNLNDITITFYELADLTTSPITVNATSQITNDTAFINTSPGFQTIYVQLVSNSTGCIAVSTITLYVNPLPTPLAQVDIDMMPLESCENDGNGPGTLQQGYAKFDFTNMLISIQNNEPGVAIVVFETEADAIANTNPVTNITNYYNTTPNNQTLWVRDESNQTGCYSIRHFDIQLGGCTLPVDNLTIQSLSETCVGLDNGMITIEANEMYAYEVSISLNGTPITINPNTFTDTITIPNLASGTYYVCVTATEINVTTCFDVYIEAVENLAGFSDRVGNNYTLHLTGSTIYTITVNDTVTDMIANSTNETIIFNTVLSDASTYVKVTTDKDCQGKFEEVVLLNKAEVTVYPNPVESQIHFTNTATIQNVVVYDISGKIIIQKEGNIETLNVRTLKGGLYFIAITTPTKTSTIKFLKQ